MDSDKELSGPESQSSHPVFILEHGPPILNNSIDGSHEPVDVFLAATPYMRRHTYADQSIIKHPGSHATAELDLTQITVIPGFRARRVPRPIGTTRDH